MRIALLLTTLLLLSSALHADDTELEVIHLTHRPASEISRVIHPLLSPEEGISWYGNQLIVRARPGTIDAIRRLVSEIDLPLRSLRIEVMWGEAGGDSRRDVGLPEGPLSTADRPEVRMERRITTRRESRTQVIRVIEGETALIRRGTSVAWPELLLLRNGELAAAGIVWKDIDSGFTVRPTLLGERVRLEIEAIHDTEDPAGGGRILTRGAQTVVTVEPGEWVEIGGSTEERHAGGRRILGATRTEGSEEGRLFVRALPD